MGTISINESKNIIGGGSFSGAFLEAAKNCVKTIFEIGQAVGGSIRRISSGNLCRF